MTHIAHVFEDLERRLAALEEHACHFRMTPAGEPLLVWRGSRIGIGGAGAETDPVAMAALAAHASDSTSIHGIADTAQLALLNATNTFTMDQIISSAGADALRLTASDGGITLGGDIPLSRQAAEVGTWNYPKLHLPKTHIDMLGIYTPDNDGVWLASDWSVGISHTLAFYNDSAATPNTGYIFVSMRWDTDAHERFAILDAGKLMWGPGNTTIDTDLFRGGVNLLQTSVKFQADMGMDAGSDKITNVANGTAAGDAVNFSQLGAKQDPITAGNALAFTGLVLDVVPGTGLEISADTIRVATALAGDGLTGGGGSALAVNAGSGLEIVSDAIRVAAALAGDGLAGGGGTALSVNAGSGLELSGDAIRVAAALAGDGLLGGAGSALSVNAGGGLEVVSDVVRIAAAAAGDGLSGGAGSALAVNVGTGLQITTDAVTVVFGTGSGQVTQGNDSRIPTQSENDALVGTQGTPSSSNPYVTDADSRLAASLVAVDDAIMAFNPAQYLTLGPTDGLTDQSGNGRNGTGGGGITIGGSTVLTADGLTSTNFDGTDDKITTSYNPFAQNSARTFMGFAMRDTHDNNDTIFSGAASQGPLALMSSTQGQITWTCRDGIGDALTAQSLAAYDSIAFHWALVWDKPNNYAQWFINGTPLTKMALGGNEFIASPGNIQLGVYTDGSSIPWDGKMVHYAVYEQALSPGSILWIASAGFGRYPYRDWGMTTTLPTAAMGAQIGDRCQYVADLTNGVIWNLIYDGQGSYPWKFVGGSPIHKFDPDARSLTTTGGWQTVPTDAITFDVPLAGDYDLKWEAEFNSAASAQWIRYGYSKEGVNPNDEKSMLKGGVIEFGGQWESGYRGWRYTGCAAGDTFLEKYSISGGTFGLVYRRVWCTPVRVG